MPDTPRRLIDPDAFAELHAAMRTLGRAILDELLPVVQQMLRALEDVARRLRASHPTEQDRRHALVARAARGLPPVALPPVALPPADPRLRAGRYRNRGR